MMTKDEIKDMRMEATWMENEGRTWDDESLTLLSIMYFDGIGTIGDGICVKKKRNGYYSED